MIIHNRQQLVEWLEDHAPTPTALRAARDGGIELLGFFNPIPSSSNPGWIVQITSLLSKQVFNIVVAIQKKLPVHYAWQIGPVPWKNWNPYDVDEGMNCGDKPEAYRVLREMAGELHE